MATLSIAVLTAGLIWPHIAMGLLQALVVALALAYVGARTYRSSLPEELSSDSYSPFDGVAADPPTSTRPPAVRHLATLLRAVTDPEDSQRAPIPTAARQIIIAETSRRLTEKHSLSLLRPADHSRVRALLSDATWSLVRTAQRDRPGSQEGDTIPMNLLEDVLDDVERL